ncbi:TA system VapC family ribonuclease toxin [Agilicoccus flavus]|uniref:TA system VapC family ribonuclease toxin n=1 Tax=Agilicoccus flavus TaxID=2775968 RepID=UPI001CF6AF35|nr:TA system VapC family ribonuclease toxin [Agilicoccus flavus]
MTTETPVRRLLDVNVLLALIWDRHLHHEAARRQFRAVATAFATTAVTESGLVRLLLTPAVVGRKVSTPEALGALRDVRSLPGWAWLDDDASFDSAVVDVRVMIGRRQVTDMHLVDLAARHGQRLATFDTGLVSSLAPADHHHVDLWSP